MRILDRYKIEIWCKNPLQNQNITRYIQEDYNFLATKIYEDAQVIARGYILDFYSIFKDNKYTARSDMGGGNI